GRPVGRAVLARPGGARPRGRRSAPPSAPARVDHLSRTGLPPGGGGVLGGSGHGRRRRPLDLGARRVHHRRLLESPARPHHGVPYWSRCVDSATARRRGAPSGRAGSPSGMIAIGVTCSGMSSRLRSSSPPYVVSVVSAEP